MTEKIFQLASNWCFEWEEKWGSVVSPRGKPPRVSFWCFVKRYFILPRSHAPPREMMYDRSRRPGNHARRGLDSESSSLEDLETSRRLVANLFRGKRERERDEKKHSYAVVHYITDIVFVRAPPCVNVLFLFLGGLYREVWEKVWGSTLLYSRLHYGVARVVQH